MYKYACTDRARFTCYTYGVPVYTWFKFLIRVWYALFWLNLLHIVYLFNTKEQFILWCKSWFVDILNDVCVCHRDVIHSYFTLYKDFLNLSTVDLIVHIICKCLRSLDIIFQQLFYFSPWYTMQWVYIWFTWAMNFKQLSFSLDFRDTNLQQKCHLITGIFQKLQCISNQDSSLVRLLSVCGLQSHSDLRQWRK